MIRKLLLGATLALLVLNASHAQTPPVAAPAEAGPLSHTVWIGPGCDSVVTMDQLFQIVGATLQEAGTRAKDKMDRVELQCAGALTEDRKGLHAYLTAEVVITRKVRYGANIARVLLNRDIQTIQLDAQTEDGLREPLRGALRQILKGPLDDYSAGRYTELTPAPAPAPPPAPPPGP